MWIRTQNRQKLINSDHIIDIFIDKSINKIYTESTDCDLFELGEYEDKDACMAVLDIITRITGYKEATYIYMPPKGDVKDWASRVDFILDDNGL